MSKYLLAIDQGTSGCKTTLFDIDGQVIGSETRSYKTTYPKVNWAEQNPVDWWDAICKNIQKIIKETRINPKNIVGIGIDGTGWACLPIDKDGQVLHPAMIWLDRRAEKEAEWMKKNIGESALIELCGNPVDPAYITPKILWLKNNYPELYAKTYKFLQSNAYIAYKLTGQISQDLSQGYGFHFFDIKKGEYNQKIAKKLGISLNLLAPIVSCQQVVGEVHEVAAKLTGLTPGIPVVAGGLDAACCSLGAGVINVGQTQEQGGQAGGMSIVLDQPRIHPKLVLGYHVIPGKWLLQGASTGGGGTLNWFNKELGYQEKSIGELRGVSSFAVMSEEAETIQPGSDGLIFLPYMAGERSPLWNSNAKGVYYGLSFNKTRAHMIRSTMEGVAFSLKHNLETAMEVGSDVSILSSVGGSANSKVWTQIKADVTQKTIEVPFSDHATTLGAALLAGVGVGVYKDIESAVEKTVKIQRLHQPNKENQLIYEKQYRLYKKLSQTFVNEFWS